MRTAKTSARAPAIRSMLKLMRKLSVIRFLRKNRMMLTQKTSQMPEIVNFSSSCCSSLLCVCRYAGVCFTLLSQPRKSRSGLMMSEGFFFLAIPSLS